MIIGRDYEKSLLNKAFLSRESEFIVIYGRRRVGKTYLIREFFSQKKGLFFHVTGGYREKLKVQLQRFTDELSRVFFDGVSLNIQSWEEAFKLLQQKITQCANQKVTLFLDELPWLVTRRSGLLQLIDYYWNHYWSATGNVILVVCGSSASWLIKNIIYNKGGLHNRVTCELRLMPFNLCETEAYLKSRKIKLNHQHILSLYMVLGGIPYYLKYVEPGLSSDQVIQNLLFSDKAPLRDEFNKLFYSLFEKADAYIELIKIIATHRSGIKRADIEENAKLSSNGGRLSERLQDLCRAGFLQENISWNKSLGEYYKIIDEFTLFQLYWVLPRKNKSFPEHYWLDMSRTPSYISWSGYAFENVCMKHISQVLNKLSIKSVNMVDSWQFIPKQSTDEGAQIDLLIDRYDEAITICEIKFTNEPFLIDKAYAKKLQARIEIFKSKTKTKKQIFLAFISANGLKPSVYSEEMVDGLVTLDDLFTAGRSSS